MVGPAASPAETSASGFFVSAEDVHAGTLLDLRPERGRGVVRERHPRARVRSLVRDGEGVERLGERRGGVDGDLCGHGRRSGRRRGRRHDRRRRGHLGGRHGGGGRRCARGAPGHEQQGGCGEGETAEEATTRSHAARLPVWAGCGGPAAGAGYGTEARDARLW